MGKIRGTKIQTKICVCKREGCDLLLPDCFGSLRVCDVESKSASEKMWRHRGEIRVYMCTREPLPSERRTTRKSWSDWHAWNAPASYSGFVWEWGLLDLLWLGRRSNHQRWIQLARLSPMRHSRAGALPRPRVPNETHKLCLQFRQTKIDLTPSHYGQNPPQPLVGLFSVCFCFPFFFTENFLQPTPSAVTNK